MARKRKHTGEHPNHERWLVSYADFITLLFAFFVVMFASSQIDKAKAQQVSDSVRKAFEEGQLATAVAAMLGKSRTAAPKPPEAAVDEPHPGPDAEAALPDLMPSVEYLLDQLRNEIEKGQMKITMEPRGLVITLREAAFFPSGEDTLAPSTHGSLEKVAEAIRGLPNSVRLEGHTDSRPIRNSRFRSNWELSVARAIAVLELFAGRLGIPYGRLAVAGYADTIPVDTNETAEGRAHNRRVDIVILNQTGLGVEPSARQQ